MKQVTAFGSVNSNGEFRVYSRDSFLHNVSIHLKSSNVQIIVEKMEGELSHSWRKYYFRFVVNEIRDGIEASGGDMSADDVDQMLRGFFLFKEDYDEENDVWVKTPHTLKKGETEVTKSMFTDFCTKCIQWAAENLGLQIPYINENINN